LPHCTDGVLGASLDFANQLADRLRLTLAALGQLADLVRHHREATPMLASPRRLDGCIQGQQIGLLGDVINGLDHGADLVAQPAQLLNLGSRSRNHLLDLGHAIHRLADRVGALAVAETACT
jgi:hypothetical protein